MYRAVKNAHNGFHVYLKFWRGRLLFLVSMATLSPVFASAAVAVTLGSGPTFSTPPSLLIQSSFSVLALPLPLPLALPPPVGCGNDPQVTSVDNDLPEVQHWSLGHSRHTRGREGGREGRRGIGGSLKVIQRCTLAMQHREQ